MLDIAKIQANIKKRQEEHDRIWNAAIEAAAIKADKRGLIGMKELAEQIRSLKK